MKKDRTEAMSPAESKKKHTEEFIEYGIQSSPFGDCMIAWTKLGVCSLSFVGKASRYKLLQELKDRWPKASVSENSGESRKLINQIFSSPRQKPQKPLPLFLKGTPFQIKVWQALLHIPPGSVVSYEDVATFIHKKKAVRAVANAIGRNPISYIIPCHRVIRKSGDLGGYGGGLPLKKAMLAIEGAGSAKIKLS